MQNVLTGFLTAGLLPIGEDDEKLKLLEAAAAELAKQVKTAPLLAQRFALVGLDENVHSNDPVHNLASVAILDKWQTITNKVGAGPVQVFRAVILRALEIAAADDHKLSLAVTLVSENLPTDTTGSKEQGAINSMLAAFEQASEKALAEVWVDGVDLRLPKLTRRVEKVQVNKEQLAQGPDAIFNAVEAGMKSCAEGIQEGFREAVQVLVQAVNKMAIRDAKSELLWLRTSLYSPSAGRSYRELSPQELIWHAALDTSRMVNAAAPPAVAFFVRELVTPLTPKKVALSDLLKVVTPKLANTAEAAALAKDTLGATGRRGILDYAGRPSTAASLEDQTGFKEDHEESGGDMAVRLYRDLQILKLLSPS